ncbi:hypothetical protein FYJ34_07705 [Clostridiaceae bacterium 68-1-5]|uniref:Uncharacterized protein n=2 Tax=Suipraeoptans intestinalis TaxID=2606628 RepID=A0A6N7UT70_9FIRM|nr:hypothetical protein [Suipraeoptans intestinalis]
MTAVLSSAVKSGSKAAASVAVQKGLDIASDTVVDIAQNISQGKKITLASAAGSLAFNIVTAGNANGSTKSVTNSIADSTEDSVRRKAKDSLGNSVSRSGSKPNQIHHFATNKSKKYTSQFENITQKYGLGLDGDWNKELMPHQGRHPYAYHEYVLDNMQKFDKIAKGDKTKLLKLLDQMK